MTLSIFANSLYNIRRKFTVFESEALSLKHKLTKNNLELILHGSLLMAMFSIAVPVVINSFLQTMYNLTDTYWLGRIGTSPLAAINLVTPLQSVIVGFGSGLTVAGSVLISQYVGANQMDRARRMANQIFSCSMIFCLVCVTLIELFIPSIVTWLGADGETWQHAVVYMRVVALDMPFLFMVNLFQATHQAQGDTLSPMLLNLLGISVNMVLDPLLMVVWHFGAAGAAAATVMAKAVPAVIALWLLVRPSAAIRLNIKLMPPRRDFLGDILRIGLPTALGHSTMQLGFLLMSRNVYAYGVGAMAAYGIGNKVNGLISLPVNGIGSAVSIIVGQNMGAGQPERAKSGCQISMRCAVLFLLAGGVILSRPPISRAVVSIFSTDADVIAMAADFLSVMALWSFTNGIYNCVKGLLDGTGHTEISMAVEVSRLWVFRFATLFFCEHVLGMGVRSVWYSVVISNGICAAILYGFYLAGVWRKNRVKLDH